MSRFLQALKSLATGRTAATKIVEEKEVPSSAFSAAVALLRELAWSLQAQIPDRAKRCVSHYLSDKLPAERIFLASVLLTALLFAVIVPAYEAVMDGRDHETGDEEPLSVIPSPRASIHMYKYKPGVGVVFVEANVSGIADAPLMRALSSGSSSSSVESHSGSFCMETIEESEDEDLEVEDADGDRGCVGEGRKEARIVPEGHYAVKFQAEASRRKSQE